MFKYILILIMQTRFYGWALKKQVPFIRFTTKHTEIRGHQYAAGYSILQQGHIVGCIDSRSLSGIAVPYVTGGILSHIAPCVGKRDPINPNLTFADILPTIGHGQGLEIVEMTHLDFTFSDFYDLCHTSDRVVIMDCMDWDKDYKEQIVEALLGFRDSLYDVNFDMLTTKFLYCSEIVLQADRKVGSKLKVNLEDFMGLGREYLSPDGLFTGDNMICLWDSKGELQGKTGKQIKKIIFDKKGEKC